MMRLQSIWIISNVWGGVAFFFSFFSLFFFFLVFFGGMDGWMGYMGNGNGSNVIYAHRCCSHSPIT